MKLKPQTHSHARIAAALAAAVLGAISSLSSAPAQAADYRFHQGGYAGGATVSGYFSGVDLDEDGWLFGYELSDYRLTFSGNAAVAAFTHTLQDLNGIGYLIGHPTIGGGGKFDHLASSTYFPVLNAQGEDEFVSTQFDSFGWPSYEIPGTVTIYPAALSSMSFELIQVSPISAVPEPQSWVLLGAGLGLVGFKLRQRSRPRGRPTLTPTHRPGPLAALQRWLDARQRR